MTNLAAAMDLTEQLAAHRAAQTPRIEAAMTLEELDEVEAEAVGKRSFIATARRSLGELEPEARAPAGRVIQEVGEELRALIDAKRVAIGVAAEAERLAADRVDVTLPGRRPALGTLNLVEETMDEIVDIFVSIGYTVAKGPEAETRTHTSPMQARFMEEHDPPVHVVVPGRVYRRDALDATHMPVFHQVEGLAVAEDITFADLKGTLAYFAKEFFGTNTEVKFQPDHFPFTEPSAQMHAYAMGRWIELLGCGMVHPAVFEYVGYDPAVVTGFAFGMGADRMAMVRHGINDLRHMYDPDHRILGQNR
jgi:phenylalanyl-tRNA synthetase alpha chain